MSDSYKIGQEYDIGLIGTDMDGEGFVRIGESFASKNDILQIDLLGDWIIDLQNYREQLIEDRRECDGQDN